MSTHCRVHPNDPQVTEGCWGCMQDGDVLLKAFRKIKFRGGVNLELVAAATEALRRNRFFSLADLLEASAEAWNELDWGKK